MQDHPRTIHGDPVPQILRDWLGPLRHGFTAPSWEHVLVLVMGALLATGKRTVTSCLRVTGRAEAANFATYHQILSRARWCPRAVARRLLAMVIECLVPDGPIVIGMDDTIERRWGRKISARGIYRDPVRSSHGHFVKASGLRWLSFMVLTPVPWTRLMKALPVLTLLAPSERADHQALAVGRRAQRAHGVGDVAKAVVPEREHMKTALPRHGVAQQVACVAIECGHVSAVLHQQLQVRQAAAALHRVVQRARVAVG